MTWQIWMRIIIVLVLSNFLTWLISWHLGRRNGEKWEKYRQETRVKMDHMPYSDRFRQDLLPDPDNPPPLLITRRKRNIRGQWTEE